MVAKRTPKIRKRHERSTRKRAATREPEASSVPSPDQDAEAVEGGSIRLQKILAAAGIASRRGSEEYLRTGRVTVNGEHGASATCTMAPSPR